MDSYPKKYEIEIVEEGCSEPYSYMLEDDFGTGFCGKITKSFWSIPFGRWFLELLAIVPKK